MSSGQNIDPKGLFYGGRSLQFEIKQVLTFIKTFIESLGENSILDKVIHIDYSSGFGEFGVNELFTNNDSDGSLKNLFGDELYIFKLKNMQCDSHNHRFVKGKFIDCVHGLIRSFGIDCGSVSQKIGTYEFSTVLRAMRLENTDWRENEFNKIEELSVERKMLTECFYPKSFEWRRDNLNNGEKKFVQIFSCSILIYILGQRKVVDIQIMYKTFELNKMPCAFAFLPY